MSRLTQTIRMTSSEKYCLKVDEFESNFFDSLRDVRFTEDLSDVTLVSDDETFVKAHKLVLSASSVFFKKIFMMEAKNIPVLYIRGLSEKDLKNVVDFVYNGEVQVEQKELSKFIEVANDLKLKGMFQNDKLQMPKQISPKQKMLNKRSKQIKLEEMEKHKHYEFENLNESTDIVVDVTHLVVDSTDMVADFTDKNVETFVDEDKGVQDIDYDDLNAKIEEMLLRENGLWNCKMCEKSSNKKSNIKSHIETNHMNNSIPCKFCEVIVKNRPALGMHVKAKH